MRYVRDHVQIPVSQDYFETRTTEGWKLRAIEWERDEFTQTADRSNSTEPAPYGLEVVSESLNLSQNPSEIAVLLTILEMVVKDKSVPLISEELNRRNFKTRNGGPWSAPAVFDLLPRVIEMGPTLLQSREWLSLRPRMTTA